MTISSIPNSSVASTLSTLGTTTGSASGTSSASNTASTATSSLSQLGSQSYFLQLLVAQMNNQDPLNPMDSAQVTSQLAQINTVSGIQTLSTQLTSLLASSTAGQSSLVGQQVLVPGTTLNLPAGGSAHGGVGLATAATQVSITIKNASGQVVDTMNLGAEPAGTTNFTWDAGRAVHLQRGGNRCRAVRDRDPIRRRPGHLDQPDCHRYQRQCRRSRRL
jgi:flagellar basal-body rod modification protein FlgD